MQSQQIGAVLTERGNRYGEFSDNANLAQALKRTAYSMPGAEKLEDLHKEALDYIFGKIARIVNGDPNYQDNWVDIAGFATLVADRVPKIGALVEVQSLKEGKVKNGKNRDWLGNPIRPL